MKSQILIGLIGWMISLNLWTQLGYSNSNSSQLNRVDKSKGSMQNYKKYINYDFFDNFLI